MFSFFKLYYNTGDLRENTNTGGQRERGVKYGSFPAKTGDLTAMVPNADI